MPYPAPFHRLVMIGSLYSDVFNTTVSIIPSSGTLPAVGDSFLATIAGVVSTWWPKVMSASIGGGAELSVNAKLTSIKLNRIGTDGRYMDAAAKEYVYPSPIVGGDAINFDAPQLTVAATLRGTNERARAGKGRMYFPPSTATSGAQIDGRLTVATAKNYANGVATLLIALDDAYSGASVPGVVGITSKVGAGAFQTVTAVSVGRVIDTMRSRRNKLAEDPQYTSVD